MPVAHVNLRDVNLAVAEVGRVKGKAKGIFYTPPEVARRVGAEHMLWVTDYPHIDAHKDPLVELREHIAPLSPEEQEWILGKAAAELYRL